MAGLYVPLKYICIKIKNLQVNPHPRHLGRVIFTLQKFRARGVLVFNWLTKNTAFPKVWRGAHLGWAPWVKWVFACRPHFVQDGDLTNRMWVGRKNFDTYLLEFDFEL